MGSIRKFTQILFAGLLVLVLATSSAGADTRLPDVPDRVITDCKGIHQASGSQTSSSEHSSGIPSHCCSIGHCWVATQTEAPAVVVEIPRFRVADLTQEIAVIPVSTRLEKPPQRL
jgi:hypothetical protein